MNLTTLFIICNLTTFVLTILSIIHISRLWRLRSIRWLLLLSVSFLVSSFCAVSVYIVQDFSDKVFFFQMRVLGMIFLAPTWLYFISSVFERWSWLHKKWVISIIFIPCIINFLMMLFPATRNFLFTDFKPYFFHDLSVVQFKTGSWYNFFYIWAVLLTLMSYVVSVVAFFKSKGQRRRQVLILNISLAVAFIQSLSSFSHINAQELEWIMGSAVSLLFTQVGIIYAVLRHQMLSIIPLAMTRIFEQLPDPVFVIDDKKRVMGVSDSGKKFFNLPKNFLGLPIEDVIPQSVFIPGEIELTGPDRRKYYFNLAIEKIGGDLENSPGAILFYRDIGAQKNVEMRLSEGMEFRARLLALLAHDLTGFLEAQAIIGKSLQESVGPEHHEKFELLASSSMASQNLVSNVMDWVKNQSMNFETITRSFEWNFLIKDILEQLESHISLKGVNVIFTPSANHVVQEADSEMIASILRNIISNAIRSTPTGKKIYVSFEEKSDFVEVKIRDEGCGIMPDELNRILKASSEFLLSGVSKTHGAGIGLMVVRHFIALHNGHFSMTSKPGAGTEVTFSIFS